MRLSPADPAVVANMETVAANMDGTTEPILTILGHPIAGNPSQFAIERALRDMDLEWRVLSFDVGENDIAAALDGLEVLGIRGVLVDSSVSRAVSQWYAAKHSDPAAKHSDPAAPSLAIDCLYRDGDGILRGSCELGDWFAAAEVVQKNAGLSQADAVLSPADAGSIEAASGLTQADAVLVQGEGGVSEAGDGSSHANLGASQAKGSGSESSSTAEKDNWIWLGDDEGVESPSRAVPRYERLDLPPDPQRVSEANFIVLAETGELEVEDWPASDGSTIVIDLTEGHPERDRLEQLGYRFVDEFERRSATLSGCLRRWTGQQAPHDVIRDAIEEYLGV